MVNNAIQHQCLGFCDYIFVISFSIDRLTLAETETDQQRIIVYRPLDRNASPIMMSVMMQTKRVTGISFKCPTASGRTEFYDISLVDNPFTVILDRINITVIRDKNILSRFISVITGHPGEILFVKTCHKNLDRHKHAKKTR